ncbi:MAG: glycosyltransferase family 4 protein [candidate division KSB1 bacterium]|nr:glycosyltransferase family 4 protein [candidate division KSB1 bacterium]
MKSAQRNILMLLQSDFPPDIRVSKEIKALTKAGHKIYLLCNNKNLPEKEIIDGAYVIRLPRMNFLPSKAAKILRMPFFFNPLWFYLILKVIRKERIDIIHVHDLPLAPLAVGVGKLTSLSVVYDMHENYPAAMAIWAKRLSWLERQIKNPIIAQKLNRFAIKHAERIIVVVEEHRDKLIKEGVSPNKLAVVGNTVDVQEFLGLPIDTEIIDQFRSYFTILYIGSFAVDRGLETAILAMKYLKDKIPNVRLLLVGSGKNLEDLQQLTKNENLEGWVEFVGWVPFKKVPSFVSAAKVCIIPQPSNPANDSTIPHKLFQYMLLEKPVLVSDAAPLKRIVEECKCGKVFRSDDPKHFSEMVQSLYESSETYGANGRKWVERKYNWGNASKNLIALYSSLS